MHTQQQPVSKRQTVCVHRHSKQACWKHWLCLDSCCCKATYPAAVSHKVPNYPDHCTSLHCCSCSSCSQQQNTQEEDQDMEAGDDDDDDQPFTRKPFTRTMQKQERDALQKWVQCAKCAKWRKVSFSCLLTWLSSRQCGASIPIALTFLPFPLVQLSCYKLKRTAHIFTG